MYEIMAIIRGLSHILLAPFVGPVCRVLLNGVNWINPITTQGSITQPINTFQG